MNMELTFIKNKFTLRYENDTTEEAFSRYIQPRVLVYLVPMYFIFGVVVLFAAAGTDPAWFAPWRYGNVILFFGFMVVQIVLLLVQRRVAGKNSAREHATNSAVDEDIIQRVVAVEHFGISVNIFYGVIVNNVQYWGRIKRHDCEGFFFAVDGAADGEYGEANCRNLLPQLVIAVAVATLLQVFRFTTVVAYALWVSATFVITYFGVLDSPGSELQLLLFGAIVAIAGNGFVCAVRYDHERSQQRQFELQQRLQAQLTLLRMRRRDLLAYCRGLIPDALLAKTAASGSLTSAADDFTPSGVVALAGVADYSTFTREHLDIDVARLLSKVHTVCIESAARLQLQRVMTIGDLFVCLFVCCHTRTGYGTPGATG